VVALLNDCLLSVMKQGPELGIRGRQERLRPMVARVYDMAAMARSTLGVAGAKLSPDDAAKLADSYTIYSVAEYADQFKEWDGERFEADAPVPAANGLTLVRGRIVPASGDPVAIDYLMHEENGAWKIVDVLFDGSISQVAVRRSEFVPIFRRAGVAGLITMLDSKSASLGHNNK
jgi:phospholipid transport system substrate-binding protein